MGYGCGANTTVAPHLSSNKMPSALMVDPDITHRDSIIRSPHVRDVRDTGNSGKAQIELSPPSSRLGPLGTVSPRRSPCGALSISPEPNTRAPAKSTINAPENVSVVQFGNTQAKVSWSPVEGASEYNVHNVTTGEFFIRRNCTMVRPEISAVMSGLLKNRDYTFAVCSIDMYGAQGNASNHVNVHIYPNDADKLSSPNKRTSRSAKSMY